MVKASDKIQEGPKLQEQSGAFCILTVSEKSTGADQKTLRSSTVCLGEKKDFTAILRSQSLEI